MSIDLRKIIDNINETEWVKFQKTPIPTMINIKPIPNEILSNWDNGIKIKNVGSMYIHPSNYHLDLILNKQSGLYYISLRNEKWDNKPK